MQASKSTKDMCNDKMVSIVPLLQGENSHRTKAWKVVLRKLAGLTCHADGHHPVKKV